MKYLVPKGFSCAALCSRNGLDMTSGLYPSRTACGALSSHPVTAACRCHKSLVRINCSETGPLVNVVLSVEKFVFLEQ